MILGHSAAAAACLSLDGDIAVQDVDYAALRTQLDAEGQVLTLPAGTDAHREVDPRTLPGVVVDDRNAQRTGDWIESSSSPGFIGVAYLHDNNESQGAKSVTYELVASKAGRYQVRLSYTPNANRATNVRVNVETEAESAAVTINQRQQPPIEGRFISLGNYDLGGESVVRVTISNAGADGHVIADAVQLLLAPDAGRRTGWEACPAKCQWMSRPVSRCSKASACRAHSSRLSRISSASTVARG